MKKDDPGRREDRNAFADEDPDFSLGAAGPRHSLILNKYCVMRPQFILHTNEFERRSDPVSLADMAATWSVLGRLGASGYMAIYNCGVEAGSSL